MARFYYDTGTITVSNDSPTVVGNGTDFTGDLEGAVVTAYPAGQAPVKVGVVAAVSPEGEYEPDELPLVKNYKGTALVAVEYTLEFPPSQARGAHQTAVFDKLLGQLRSLGLVGDADSFASYDQNLIPNNTLLVNIAGRKLEWWKDALRSTVLDWSKFKTVLTTSLTIWVSATGAGDGLSEATPLGSLQAAAALYSTYDFNGNTVTIKAVGSGTHLFGPYLGADANDVLSLLGWTGPGTLIIEGDVTNPGRVSLASEDAPCIRIPNEMLIGGRVRIQGLSFSSTGSAAIRHSGFGKVECGVLRFGAVLTYGLAVDNPLAQIIGSITQSGLPSFTWGGNCSSPLNADAGWIYISTQMALHASIVVDRFAFVHFNGWLMVDSAPAFQLNGHTVTGGPRATIEQNGYLQATGQGWTFLPGDEPVECFSGGKYTSGIYDGLAPICFLVGSNTTAFGNDGVVKYLGLGVVSATEIAFPVAKRMTAIGLAVQTTGDPSPGTLHISLFKNGSNISPALQLSSGLSKVQLITPTTFIPGTDRWAVVVDPENSPPDRPYQVMVLFVEDPTANT